MQPSPPKLTWCPYPGPRETGPREERGLAFGGLTEEGLGTGGAASGACRDACAPRELSGGEEP